MYDTREPRTARREPVGAVQRERTGKKGHTVTFSARILAVSAYVLLLALTPSGVAQTQPQAESAAAPAADTRETIQARITQIEGRDDLDEAVKTRVLDGYRQALANLADAETWKARVDEFESATRSAPERLTQLETELAKPSDVALPQPPDGGITPRPSLTDLEAKLGSAMADLQVATQEQQKLEEEFQRRTNRRVELPNLITDAKTRLAQIDAQIATPAGPDETAEATNARRTRLRTRKQSIELELRAYEREVESYEARGKLLTARRAFAQRQVGQLDKIAKAWQQIVENRRQSEAASERERAEQALRDKARSAPEVRAVLEENVALAANASELAAKIRAANDEQNRVRERLQQVSESKKNTENKVEEVGLTDNIGRLLRNKLYELPDVRQSRRNLRDRKALINQTQFERLLYDEQAVELADLDARAAELRDKALVRLASDPSSADDIERIERELRQALEEKRNTLGRLIETHESYYIQLLDLDNEERQLVAKVEEYADYIATRVLWVRSAQPPWRDFRIHQRALGQAAAWFLTPSHWLRSMRSLALSVTEAPWSIAALTAIALLLVFRRRLRRLVNTSASARDRRYSFTPTVRALIASLLLAIPIPALLLLIGLRLGASVNSDDFARALSRGFVATAALMLPISIARQLVSPKGLGANHFIWQESILRSVRLHIHLLASIALPAVFVAWTIEGVPGRDLWSATLGRIAYLTAIGTIIVFFYRILNPRVRAHAEMARNSWEYRVLSLQCFVGTVLPGSLFLVATLGYYYTALRLSGTLLISLLVLLAYVIAIGMTMQALRLARKRLRLQQFEERRRLARERAEAQTEGEAPEGALTAAASPTASEDIDIVEVSAQAQQLTRTVLGAAAFVLIAWAWIDVMPALGILRKFQLTSNTVEATEMRTDSDGREIAETITKVVPVTLADVLIGLAILVGALFIARKLPALLEIVLLQRLPIGAGERYAITTITNYGITAAGIAIAFTSIGIGWSKVQWIVAAVSFGLGFGLQEIFANFVSGLIILFERPVRVGDVVTVGTVEGRVSRIRMRATTLRDWDRREMVIPNREIITTKLINWTLSDPVTREIIQVGVAYGSNTQLTHDTLMRVATQCRWVLTDPAPRVLFRRFGESTLHFELRVFIATRDYWPDLIHDLNMNIERALGEAGIEIAFPQRDLHIRSADGLRPWIEGSREGADADAPPREVRPSAADSEIEGPRAK